MPVKKPDFLQIMGTEKPMELIELPNSDAASVDTAFALTALSSTQKLEDWFDKEIYIPMTKQPMSIKKKNVTAPPHITITAQASQQVVKKKTSATPTHITTITKGSHPVDQNIDFIFQDEVDITNNANDALEMKPSATKSQHPVEPEDFNSHVFNDEEDYSKVMDLSILDQPTHTVVKSPGTPMTNMTIVNIDHMKAFHECMGTYGILNGVQEFDIVALVIAFYKSACNTRLVIMKSCASNYQQYSCRVYEGCNFHVSFG